MKPLVGWLVGCSFARLVFYEIPKMDPFGPFVIPSKFIVSARPPFFEKPPAMFGYVV